jgi:hypothetical protein
MTEMGWTVEMKIIRQQFREDGRARGAFDRHRAERRRGNACDLHSEPDIRCPDCLSEIERRATDAATLVSNDIEVRMGPW